MTDVRSFEVRISLILPVLDKYYTEHSSERINNGRL